MSQTSVSKAGATPKITRALFLFNAVLVLILSVSLGFAIALYSNTLDRHPEWIASKSKMARPVMGAIAFESLQQSLAGNRLNLGAWFGYQEVLLAEPTSLKALESSLWLEEDAYLHVLYDHDATGFSGLRFSLRPDYPSIQYRATPQAEFIDTNPLDLDQRITPGTRSRLRLEFAESTTRVLLDATEIGRFPRRPTVTAQVRFGFRGSQRNSWIDDVVWVDADGNARSETFSNPHSGKIIALSAAAIAILAILLLLVLRFFGVPDRLAHFRIATTMIVLIVLSGIGYVAQFYAAKSYPVLSQPTQDFEQFWIKSSYASILEEIATRHPKQPEDGTYRILVVGGSQTWGAGALLDSETWVRQTEAFLNAKNPEPRFELINGGVSGFTSRNILGALQDHLLAYHPHAVVLDIGNNDLEREKLIANFSVMLDLFSARGIKPLLVLEPNSPEKRLADSRHGSLIEKHRALEQVAKSRGVPTLDMHVLLAEQRNAGILWWDFSHLTSLGQRLFAERLSEWIATTVGNEPG